MQCKFFSLLPFIQFNGSLLMMIKRHAFNPERIFYEVSPQKFLLNISGCREKQNQHLRERSFQNTHRFLELLNKQQHYQTANSVTNYSQLAIFWNNCNLEIAFQKAARKTWSPSREFFHPFTDNCSCTRRFHQKEVFSSLWRSPQFGNAAVVQLSALSKTDSKADASC